MGCLYYLRKQASVSYAADCDVIVCYGGAKPTDTHLASVIHCIDDEIIGWLRRREQRRRRKQSPSHCSAIDNPDYDESRQNEYPIGNLGTR
jgi:hypothetical protein